MTSKHLTQSIAVIAILFSISACTKSKNWTSSVTLQSTTYNTIAVDGTYDIKGAKKDVEVGICWDDEPNANLDDGSNSILIESSETRDYIIEDLYANTTYYFRTFIYNNDGTGLRYGEEANYTTQPVPDFELCSLTTGEVEHDGSIYSVDNLSKALLPDHYNMQVATSDFEFNFYFKEEPRSGKYLHDQSNTYLQDFQYYMSVKVFDGGSNCTYYPELNEIIHVSNNNGIITLSFCELNVSTSGSCTSTLLLSGELISD